MQGETRKVLVSGKTNVDGLTKKKSKRIRKVAQSEDICHSRERQLIHALHVGSEDQYADKAMGFLRAKINGYKQQDVARSLYDSTRLISLQDVIHKLEQSGLNCCYCDEAVKIMYRTVRDPKQWTLDRVDNDDCHSAANTVIACLGCNLKRRVTDKDKFEFTKRLVIKKVAGKCTDEEPSSGPLE